ncbi:alpha/beta hydrolase [Aliidiomarina minuta]|uniref:Alpha/beta hydrolase n=1 Tax=Aliidiomarina minuta TaxID=880057 RepID=A0A432W8R2_9GAMM|nr:alpha/beta hydrolase [Aliidiomarina minuta]RUO26537.1 alpha/beta hydrolase [Aliidiomarina minuta]
MHNWIYTLLSVCFLSLTVSAMANDEALQYDERLSNYSYPFDVHNFAFDSQRQSLEMAYMHLPAEEGQPTVLLLHGKNFGADYWEDTANYLHEKGYGVLMPDQIGFGKSSKPEHYQFTIEGLVNNTRELAHSLDIAELIVMGHSMGGMLASRYALNHADEVSKLVLVNPIGLEDYLRYVEYKDPAFFYANELDKTIAGVREYQREHYYDGQWSDDYEALIQIHAGWINGPDWERVAWNNALTFDMIFTGAVVNEFDQLSVPTDLIIGTRDTTGPGRGWKKEGVEYELGRFDQLGKRAAEQIPEAYLHELEDIGHMPQFEAFERYSRLLDEIF